MKIASSLLTILAVAPALNVLGFSSVLPSQTFVRDVGTRTYMSTEPWSGELVDGGTIEGCTITQSPDSLTMWQIQIDGVQADLGKFSEAIYKKITTDAKQQRYQGFRPGTLPPHLLPTYIGFAMDEAAREATLEAMEQNEIRPFEESRSEFIISNVSIPPPPKKKSKKKKGGRKKKGATSPAPIVEATPEVVEEPAWLTFDTMGDAIKSGWKPGQSFSFIAKNVKGQKIKIGGSATSGLTAVGSGGSAMDLNQIAADVATRSLKNQD